MTRKEAARDLIVLAADKNAETALRGILSRAAALGIRPVTADFIVHPEHDPGCLRRPEELLRLYLKSHRYALVVLDRKGTGQEALARADMEREIEEALSRNGWTGRSAAIVIDPELDVWVWSDSPAVDKVLGWAGRRPGLRLWLQRQTLLLPNLLKPQDPKAALEQALRESGKPRSSAIYRQLAEQVSFRRCTDPAFEKLKAVLAWSFPLA